MFSTKSDNSSRHSNPIEYSIDIEKCLAPTKKRTKVSDRPFEYSFDIEKCLALDGASVNSVEAVKLNIPLILKSV